MVVGVTMLVMNDMVMMLVVMSNMMVMMLVMNNAGDCGNEWHDGDDNTDEWCGDGGSNIVMIAAVVL